MATEAEIEILLRLRDELTAALRAARAAVSEFEGTVTSSAARVNAATATTANSTKAVTSATTTLGSTIDSTFKTISSGASMLTNAFEGFHVQIQKLAFSAVLLGTTLQVAISGPAQEILKLGFAYDDLRLGSTNTFETLYRHMEDASGVAKTLYNDIKTLADYTPFTSSTLLQGGQKLSAIGLDPDEVLAVTQTITTALTAMNKISGPAYQKVVDALSKMLEMGKVSAYELNQLTRDGIPAWSMLADGMGITVKQLREMTKEGTLPARVAMQALITSIDSVFADLAQKNAKTFVGLTSTLEDYRDLFSGMIVDTLFQSFIANLSSVVDYLPLAAEGFAKLSSGARDAIGIFVLTAAAIGPLLIGFSGLAIFVSFLMTPLGLLAAALAGVATTAIALGTALFTNFGGVRDGIGAELESLSTMFIDFANGMVEFGVNVTVGFANGMAIGVNAILDVISYIGDILSYWLSPGSPPKVYPSAFTDGVNVTTQFIGGMSSAVVSEFKNFTGLLETELRNAFALNGGGFDLYEAIFGSQQWAAKAIQDVQEVGFVTESTMAGMRSTMGPVAELAIEQAEAFGKLAKASNDLEYEQSKLKSTQRELANALRPGDQELAILRLKQRQLDIDEERGKLAQKGGSPQDIEKNALKQRALDIEYQQNALKLAAQDQINQEENKIELLKDQKDELTDQTKKYKDIADWQKQQLSLYDEFHKAASGGGGGGAKKDKLGLGDDIEKLTGDAGLLARIRGQADLLRDSFTGFGDKFKPMNEALDKLEKGVKNPFQEMVKDVEKIGTEMQRLILSLTGVDIFPSLTEKNQAARKQLEREMDALGLEHATGPQTAKAGKNTFDEQEKNFADSLRNLALSMEGTSIVSGDLGKVVLPALGRAFDWLRTDGITGTINSMAGLILFINTPLRVAFDVLEGAIKVIGALMKGDFKGAWDETVKTLWNVQGEFGKVVSAFGSAIASLLRLIGSIPGVQKKPDPGPSGTQGPNQPSIDPNFQDPTPRSPYDTGEMQGPLLTSAKSSGSGSMVSLRSIDSKLDSIMTSPIVRSSGSNGLMVSNKTPQQNVTIDFRPTLNVTANVSKESDAAGMEEDQYTQAIQAIYDMSDEIIRKFNSRGK